LIWWRVPYSTGNISTRRRIALTSVADSGCFSDPTFFISDSGSEFFPSRIRIKEFKYCNPKKWFLSSRKYDPVCSSRIRILTFYPSRIPDPGVKKAGSATLALTPLFQDTDWVDDIRKTMSLLKKNSASLKRLSSQFEPMRKPDILKLRRESLSKIMLSRKTEESRRQLLKGTVSREFISCTVRFGPAVMVCRTFG
jgi:hypothetical protein